MSKLPSPQYNNDLDTHGLSITTAKRWVEYLFDAAHISRVEFTSKLWTIRLVREAYNYGFERAKAMYGNTDKREKTYTGKQVYEAYLLGSKAMLANLGKLGFAASVEIAEAADKAEQATEQQFTDAIDAIFNHVDGSNTCTCAHCKDKRDDIRPPKDGDIFLF